MQYSQQSHNRRHVKWFPFDQSKGFRQKRPPVHRWVIVQLESTEVGSLPSGIAVGYRKNAAGDKSCPYFVVPGIGGNVLQWCDCLPLDFKYPPSKL
jgi:hypothetical protein